MMFRWLYKLWYKYVSKEPWIDMISNGIDHNGMVKLEFDWNDEFMKQLRMAGYKNPIEEEAVRDWFQSLSSQRIVELIEEVEKEREQLRMTVGATGSTTVKTDEHPHLDDPTHIEFDK